MEFCGSETAAKEQRTRQTSRDIADANKITSDGNKIRIANKKERDQCSERADSKFMHQLLDAEATEKKHHQKMEQEAVEDYEAEQKVTRERNVRSNPNKTTAMGFWGSESVAKEQQTRQTSRDIADANKITSDGNKIRIANKKERDQCSERADSKFMHQLLDAEATEKEHHQEMEQEAVEDYEAEQKVTRERKVQDEKDEDELAEDSYDYQNKVRGEEQRVSDQMHQDQEDQHTARYNTNFDIVQTLQDNQQNTYDDFIEKGIRTSENRKLAQEKTCIEQQQKDHDTAMSVSRDNQICAKKDKRRKAETQHQSQLDDQKMDEKISSWKGSYE